MQAQDSLNLGEVIDRLITIPVFSGSSLASKPVVLDLYEAARRKFGKPLCYDATERIISSAEKGVQPKNIIITTGFIVPPWMEVETDGPVGAVTLARSLNLSLDLTPIIVTERSAVAKTRSLLGAAGFRVKDEIDEAARKKRAGAVVGFTAESSEAKMEADELISKASPTSIISIEKASPNRVGVFHSGVGVNVSSLSAKVDRLITEAKNVGIPTIGIGDAGNEIGMGCIEETVRKILPTGSECGCPCHNGVASAVSTDSLIVAGTSNWGAYAIEALLSFHFKAEELLHDSSTEINLIRKAGELGFIDPASGFADPGVDAIPAQVHGSLVEILNFITKSRVTDSLFIKKYKEYTRDKTKLAEEVKEEEEMLRRREEKS